MNKIKTICPVCKSKNIDIIPTCKMSNSPDGYWCSCNKCGVMFRDISAEKNEIGIITDIKGNTRQVVLQRKGK